MTTKSLIDTIDELGTSMERKYRRIAELEETIRILGVEVDAYQQRVEELEKAIQHCNPMCPAWAALEGGKGNDHV